MNQAVNGSFDTVPIELQVEEVHCTLNALVHTLNASSVLIA